MTKGGNGVLPSWCRCPVSHPSEGPNPSTPNSHPRTPQRIQPPSPQAESHLAGATPAARSSPCSHSLPSPPIPSPRGVPQKVPVRNLKNRGKSKKARGLATVGWVFLFIGIFCCRIPIRFGAARFVSTAVAAILPRRRESTGTACALKLHVTGGIPNQRGGATEKVDACGMTKLIRVERANFRVFDTRICWSIAKPTTPCTAYWLCS
ncbi:hypothetical protein FB45DRAFT_863293 [Roridomyces roridus]|uniref:Uncharacterized protein n=1 Tax=Roridomyces roridus TaxID=1738132 RepID=A0AAD7FTV1_9AGAR|nr:hypothetical protein FB45DRAFT_863293 [Roridomyces roridus]